MEWLDSQQALPKMNLKNAILKLRGLESGLASNLSYAESPSNTSTDSSPAAPFPIRLPAYELGKQRRMVQVPSDSATKREI